MKVNIRHFLFEKCRDRGLGGCLRKSVSALTLQTADAQASPARGLKTFTQERGVLSVLTIRNAVRHIVRVM